MVTNKVDLQILFRVYKQANFPQKGNLAVELGALKYNQLSLAKAQCICIWCPAIVLIYIKCSNHPQATSQDESWSLTRGSKYSDLTWKLLAFWKTGHLHKVVVKEGLTV